MAGSRYNQRVNRELFIAGEESFVDAVTKIVKPLGFIVAKPISALREERDNLHFIVAPVDFEVTQQVQRVAKLFRDKASSQAHKIVYVNNPRTLTQSQILCAAEIGSRHTLYGRKKDINLHDYLKRVSTEAEQLNSEAHFESEISRMVRKRNKRGLQHLSEKLKEMKPSEGMLRLQVTLHMHLGHHKYCEGLLRQILTINPQNLWAANELGRLYLRLGRPVEGITTLERMSTFHDLNGERLLALGDAYLNSGNTGKAETVLERGAALSGGSDPRFQEGLAKAKLIKDDVDGALQCLQSDSLTTAVISYLNTRAVMAIKTNNYTDGYRLYKLAINGTQDRLLLAKLHYNMGLGKARGGCIEDALSHLEESVNLGGKQYQRAASSLATVRKIAAKRGAATKDQESGLLAIDGSDDFAFEDWRGQKAG